MKLLQTKEMFFVMVGGMEIVDYGFKLYGHVSSFI